MITLVALMWFIVILQLITIYALIIPKPYHFQFTIQNELKYSEEHGDTESDEIQ